MDNLQAPKQKICADCSVGFTAYNVNTRRCETCKQKPVIRTFTRNCCNCGDAFTSRNIYTVTCSQKCGHAAQGGLADRAKVVIKLRSFIKRQSKRIKKEGYQATIMTPDKLLKDCVDTWGDEYEYIIPSKVTKRPEIGLVCPEHGNTSFVYNRYEKPSKPCEKCRFNHNRITKEEYLNTCRERFGDKYTYVSEYEPGDTGKIDFYCPEHGLQKMLCRLHVRSPTGCAECSKEAMDYSRSKGCFNWGLLNRDEELAQEPYHLYLGANDSFYKVGLTKQGGESKRFQSLKYSAGLEDFKIMYSGPLIDCFKLEQFIIDNSENANLEKTFGGYTECFVSTPEQLDIVFNNGLKHIGESI